MSELTVNDLQQGLGLSHKKKVLRLAKKEGWEYRNGPRGTKLFPITGLPAQRQKEYVERCKVPFEIIPLLAPEAQLAAYKQALPIGPDRVAECNHIHIPPKVLENEQVQEQAKVIQEALSVPDGWAKRKWIETVAIRHDVHPSTVYRQIQRYDAGGLTALLPTKQRPTTAWSTEAIEYWVGLTLKRTHRKFNKKTLYNALQAEAQLRGWKIGGYRSALGHLKARTDPQLLAFQKGGVRALDNSLPPILRDYSDLAPFEIICGDQHRHDIWVVDDDTGQVFRPESYVWQDLRTRLIYGGAIAKRYDSFLMGLALRVGCKIFGTFGGTYNDNGKPETSKYMAHIVQQMLLYTPSRNKMGDRSQCFAKVKNAKAKVDERTFRELESICVNEFKVPGSVKQLTATGEEQEVDEKELKRLAQEGKLLRFSEFIAIFFQALDHYNRKKPHAGVLQEWKWQPRPKEATPFDCLAMCYQHGGWRPTKLSDDALDLIFLPQSSRKVDRGRIRFENQLFEHESLARLNKPEVDIRFDPLDLSSILVFQGGAFVCRAVPVEYSSMKDGELTRRKIEEKARLRKRAIEEYRRLTNTIPDLRQYSTIPKVETVAAQVKAADTQAEAKRKEVNREPTELELQAEVAKLKAYESQPSKPIFSTPEDRYHWLLYELSEGRSLPVEDLDFRRTYEQKMTPEIKEYWEHLKTTLGLKCDAVATTGGAVQ